jgi:cell division protein ZapE
MSIRNYLEQNIDLDFSQEKILTILDNYQQNLKTETLFERFFKNKTNFSLYLYGDVGRGKTMLLKALYDSLTISKEYVHYQEFMMNAHKIFNQNHKLNSIESAKLISNYYSKNFQILFIDELEIKDITDGMLINNIFQEFHKKGLLLLITSNSSPKNLYKNGVLRERIKPLIDFLEKKFQILNLDSNIDYRKQNISDLARVIYPFTEKNLEKKDYILANLKASNFQENTIDLFGRKVVFKKVCNDILLTDFSELCKRDLGYSDYVEICKKYKAIILLDVLKISNDSTDIMLRFVNLIDSIYFNKVLLFIFLEVEPELLYLGFNRKDDFMRCSSRLSEIASTKYFNNSKYVQYKK